MATTSMSITANLDSAASTGTTFPASVTVYDSLGAAHTVTVTYQQKGIDPVTGDAEWSYSAALPSSDFTSGVSTPVTGTLEFNSSGTLTSVTQTTPVAVAATTVGTAAGDISSIPLSFTGLSDGATNLSIGWNLLGTGSTPTISQEDTASTTVRGPGQRPRRGRLLGLYHRLGRHHLRHYSNGQTEAVGQLALANVTNQQGLSLQGDGNYATTLASGPPRSAPRAPAAWDHSGLDLGRIQRQYFRRVL